jgi:dihydroflavonol-4-reductase
MSENWKNSSADTAIKDVPDLQNKQQVFVTGGTGLVGSYLIEQLIKDGKNVKALYRTAIPAIAGTEKVQWVKGDILDISSLEEAMQDVAQVYHCAAIVSFNPKKKHKMLVTNIEGTANVVNAALQAGIHKLCYVSSVAALGGVRDGRNIDETSIWTEETSDGNYGKSKYFSELEVWRGIGEGLKAVMVNPVIILGAGNWNDSSTKIFKSVYDEFPWFTEGINGFVDVKDVVKAMIQLMESNINAERFILNAEDRTYKDIFTMIARAFGRKPPHRKVNRFIAGAVWRFEALKSMITGEEPLVTKETAINALAWAKFDGSKINNFLPSFRYTPVSETITRTCSELKEKMKLYE